MRLDVEMFVMDTAVVDANVFIHGRGSYPFKSAITVQEVVEELQSNHGANMLRNVSYEIRAPSDQYIKKVKNKSKEINSPTSNVDEKLLALAIQLGKTMLTDDIALQNLAFHLDADFDGFLEDKIEKKFRWDIICTNCGAEVSGDRCSSCGSTRTRRKQVRCS